MTQSQLVVEGGLVLDSDSMCFEPVDLLIVGGSIAEFGARGAFRSADAAVMDASNRLVIPGLVNAHSHGHGYFTKGLNREWPLELLIAASPWITGERSRELMSLSTTLGAAELLTKGCTTTVDLHTQLPLPSAEGFAAVAESYRAAGMRATVAPMVADVPFWLSAPGLSDFLSGKGLAVTPPPRPLDAGAVAAAVEEALDAVPSDAFIRSALCAAIPLSCSDPLLAALSDIAKRRGIILHTHFLESGLQGPFWTETRGAPLSRALDERGMLNDRFVAAHAIWLDDADLDLMAARGSMAAHNPVSNMRLGTGIARVKDMIERGIPVGLGTDTCSCSDNLNMFETMRTAAGLSRVTQPDTARWLDPREIFAAATLGSAKVVDRHGEIGKIAKGYHADLVLLDLEAPHYMPLNDPLTQLVHSEDGTAVDRVLVGGREVVRDGRLLTVDLGALRERARDLNRELLERVAPTREQFDRLAPAVAEFRLARINALVAS